jgi:hypothetical protein
LAREQSQVTEILARMGAIRGRPLDVLAALKDANSYCSEQCALSRFGGLPRTCLTPLRQSQALGDRHVAEPSDGRRYSPFQLQS